MYNRLFFFLLLFVSTGTFGQLLHPTKWTFKSIEDENGEVELIFNVKIDKDWHIYSQHTPDGGPIPTLFTFDLNGCYQVIGKVMEPKPKQEFDSSFSVFVYTFDKEVTFKQKVKLTSNSCKISGKIEYQACLQACIFLDTSFTIIVDKRKSALPFDSNISVGENKIKLINKEQKITDKTYETSIPESKILIMKESVFKNTQENNGVDRILCLLNPMKVYPYFHVNGMLLKPENEVF